MSVHAFAKAAPTIDPEGRHVFPNVSIETNILIDRIRGRYGEDGPVEISYAEVSSWIGRSVQTYPAHLYSARRILLREHCILVETMRTIGIRIGNDSDKLISSARDMTAGCRVFKRASRKLRAVTYAALDDKEKHEFNARNSMLGALVMLAAPASVAKVALSAPIETLPSSAVLTMFLPAQRKA